jgi:hypothetical protein
LHFLLTFYISKGRFHDIFCKQLSLNYILNVFFYGKHGAFAKIFTFETAESAMLERDQKNSGQNSNLVEQGVVSPPGSFTHYTGRKLICLF